MDCSCASFAESRLLKRHSVVVKCGWCRYIHVALLGDLCDSVSIHGKLRVACGYRISFNQNNGSTLRTSTLENRLELTVHQDVSITANRRGEVCIERDVEGVMTVFGDIQHSGTEVLGALGGLEGQ